MLFKDHDKKTDSKFKEMEEMFSLMSNKIQKVKDGLEEDTCLKLSYF